MMIDFLIVIIFAAVFIASLQDLKRREVDNYINFFLLCSGAIFLIFSAIWQNNIWLIVYGLLTFILVYILANVFYYGRIFAGGDAKLLIAIFPLFVALGFRDILLNIGIFVFLLMLAGSIYGILYNIFLVAFNFSTFRKQLKLEIKSPIFKGSLIIFVCLMVVGIFYSLALVFGLFVLFAGWFYASGKAIEKSILVREIPAKEVREGDWLVSPIRVGKRLISPDWEGITKAQLKLLAKINQKVRIKDGIPFVPAFFFALIMWVFREELFRIVLSLI